MRFYKHKKAEMLRWVAQFLNKNKEKLSLKAPAMNDLIDEFLEMQKAVHSILTGNPNVVKMNTLEKKSIRKEYVKAVAKLIAVLNAAEYKFKGKPLVEMQLTVYQLNKMPAEKLVKAYQNVYSAVKKIKNLKYYGFTDEDVRDVQAYHKEFVAIKNAPLQKKKEVALNNKTLDEGVKQCSDYLKKRIDGMMLIATEGNAGLLTEYRQLRKVLPRGQGRPSDAEVSYRKSRKQKIRLTPEV